MMDKNHDGVIEPEEFDETLKKWGNQTIIKTQEQDSSHYDRSLKTNTSVKLNGGKEFLSKANEYEGVRDFGEFKRFRL